MERGIRIFYGVLAALCTIALSILAFNVLFGFLRRVPTANDVTIDFNSIATILLTTVTVIFSVCAIVLAILGFFSFRNLKQDAARYAEAQALAEIEKAFGPEGIATTWFEQEMRRDGGSHRAFVERRIRTEVIELLPLVADRINSDQAGMAEGEPSDEGDIA